MLVEDEPDAREEEALEDPAEHLRAEEVAVQHLDAFTQDHAPQRRERGEREAQRRGAERHVGVVDAGALDRVAQAVEEEVRVAAAALEVALEDRLGATQVERVDEVKDPDRRRRDGYDSGAPGSLAAWPAAAERDGGAGMGIGTTLRDSRLRAAATS